MGKHESATSLVASARHRHDFHATTSSRGAAFVSSARHAMYGKLNLSADAQGACFDKESHYSVPAGKAYLIKQCPGSVQISADASSR